MVLILLLTAVILFVSHNVQALTITTDASYSVVDIITDSPVSDSDSKNASSGSITSHVQFTDGYYARAYASSDGVLAVKSEFGLGMTTTSSFTAEATLSDTITNPFSVPWSPILTLHIPQVTLGIWDYCHCGTDTAEYSINVLLNGSTIWSSSATLNGGYILTPDYTLTKSGTDIGLTEISDWSYLALFQSNPYEENIPLGPFNPGESFTLEYRMSATANGIDYEQGAIAAIGDPFTLTGGTITVNGGPSAPIPEPSTLLLLGSGLTGIVWLRRKNR